MQPEFQSELVKVIACTRQRKIIGFYVRISVESGLNWGETPTPVAENQVFRLNPRDETALAYQ